MLVLFVPLLALGAALGWPVLRVLGPGYTVGAPIIADLLDQAVAACPVTRTWKNRTDEHGNPTASCSTRGIPHGSGGVGAGARDRDRHAAIRRLRWSRRLAARQADMRGRISHL
ncbi:hypothetical protein [Pseudonocardia alni]|uniref:hypothetical protein n=1 Tax=Pseudonocardia alni TaxID=33907 RepID=UPI00280BA418|nr:hypothetical protein [Pseudonocardia alni]